MRNKELVNNTKLGRKGRLLIIPIIILIILLLPINTLRLSNYKTDEDLKSWWVKKGDRFYVEYTHSIQLTPVIEIYYIDENKKIILEESYFHSYGAGLPSNTPYKFQITKDGFRIYDINEEMENLIYRTGAVRANHEINIRGKAYPFLDFSKPREGVKFEVKKTTLLQYIVKEVHNVRR